MPTIGSRMSAVGRRNLEQLRRAAALELGEVVGHHQPAPAAVSPIHRRRRRRPPVAHARGLARCSRSRSPTTMHRRLPEHDRARRGPSARARRRACATARPPSPAETGASGSIDVLRRHDEQIRVERRVHPVDDRLVARARHAGEGDDQRERQHQRRDAGRRPARRLNRLSAASAPSTGRSHLSTGRSARASASDSSGLSSSATTIGEHVAGVEHGARLAEHEAGDRRPRASTAASARAQPALAGRQHLILALLQRLHRIDARRLPRRNQRGDDARGDADRRAPTPSSAGLGRDLVGALRDAVDVARSASPIDAAMPRAISTPNSSAAERSDEAGHRALAEEQPRGSAAASRRARAGCRSPTAAAVTAIANEL